MALCSSVDVTNVVCAVVSIYIEVYQPEKSRLTCGGLKVTGRVVASRDEDVVILSALERLVDGNRRSHELLLDLAETIESGLQLEVVVAVTLGNGRDNGNVVALGSYVVCP